MLHHNPPQPATFAGSRSQFLSKLQCENLDSPLAIESTQPRLSWRREACPGASERAYQITVATSLASLKTTPDLWDTGKVAGQRPHHVRYAGRPLRSGQNCYWRVRWWNHDGRLSEWSKPAHWAMGLLRPRDWAGRWIAPAASLRKSNNAAPCFYLRRSFYVPSAVRQARLYVAALGLAEPWINGERVTDDCFIPGWTDFRQRVQYVAYDVTARLAAEGENVIGFILGPGWYAGHLGFPTHRFRYGAVPALRAQLMLEYADGTRETVASNEQWRCARGAVVESHLYDGETYDARVERLGWSTADFDDQAWPNVKPFAGKPPTKCTAKRCAAVRRHEVISAVSVTRALNGEWIFDFGQNIVGWARLRVESTRGQEFVLRFGEMLQPDGNLYVANLRSAKATDRFIARGGGEEVWEPRFTFHGFRYVGLTGFKATPAPETIGAVVLHTAMSTAGGFTCSDPLINRLHQNIRWGQRGNFVEVPTDCPQRDERLGWTGDAQIFFRTAAFNMDVAAFFEKWLDDLADAQRSNGAFPDVAPDILPASSNAGNAAWADAGVICPWRLYVETGDRTVLDRHYVAMRRWIDYQLKGSKDFIRPATTYGDWLAIDAVVPQHAPTPCSLIGTAYFAYTTDLVARSARAIRKYSDAATLRRLHQQIVRAFQREFVTASGRVVGETQTGYLLALAFDLLPGRLRPRAVEHLVRLVEERGDHLTTGFVGTPLLCPVLTRFGRTDVAARLLRQDTYPSWLYTVKLGATTMWERWNSYTPEQGFGDSAMNSFNHYAYGAVGEWLYGTLGGVAPEEAAPGYRRFRCAPQPCAGVTRAKTWHDTPCGRIQVEWRLSRRNVLTLELTVPPDTQAAVRLTGATLKQTRESGRPLQKNFHLRRIRQTPHGVELLAASGRYEFVFPFRPDLSEA